MAASESAAWTKIQFDRLMVQIFGWSTIFSENRRPLFGIML